jgi:hypothetical protein
MELFPARRQPGEHLPAFVASLARGLLIGLAHQRHPEAKVGLHPLRSSRWFGALAAFSPLVCAAPGRQSADLCWWAP